MFVFVWVAVCECVRIVVCVCCVVCVCLFVCVSVFVCVFVSLCHCVFVRALVPYTLYVSAHDSQSEKAC